MDIIDLQRKAKPKEGWVEHYWFENENIGLKRTQFHRIVIPLEPFESGLDYVEQPENTEIVVEWVALGLDDPSKLDGIKINASLFPDSEASVYIGAVHNHIDIKNLIFEKVGTDKYEIKCELFIDFEHEGIAENENFDFKTTVLYKGECS